LTSASATARMASIFGGIRNDEYISQIRLKKPAAD